MAQGTTAKPSNACSCSDDIRYFSAPIFFLKEKVFRSRQHEEGKIGLDAYPCLLLAVDEEEEGERNNSLGGRDRCVWNEIDAFGFKEIYSQGFIAVTSYRHSLADKIFLHRTAHAMNASTFSCNAMASYHYPLTL